MFTQKHFTRRPDGSLVEHEGDRSGCAASECEWPWLGAMVTTLTEEGAEVTGLVKERSDDAVRLATGVGEDYIRPVAKVWHPEWGMYCPHGTKIVEAVPAEHTCTPGPPPPFDFCKVCYPDGRKVQPWPCGEANCTEADFDRQGQEQIDAYYEEMHQSYYG